MVLGRRPREQNPRTHRSQNQWKEPLANHRREPSERTIGENHRREPSERTVVENRCQEPGLSIRLYSAIPPPLQIRS
jgi:hypothetical protein